MMVYNKYYLNRKEKHLYVKKKKTLIAWFVKRKHIIIT